MNLKPLARLNLKAPLPTGRKRLMNQIDELFVWVDGEGEVWESQDREAKIGLRKCDPALARTLLESARKK